MLTLALMRVTDRDDVLTVRPLVKGYGWRGSLVGYAIVGVAFVLLRHDVRLFFALAYLPWTVSLAVGAFREAESRAGEPLLRHPNERFVITRERPGVRAGTVEIDGDVRPLSSLQHVVFREGQMSRLDVWIDGRIVVMTHQPKQLRAYAERIAALAGRTLEVVPREVRSFWSLSVPMSAPLRDFALQVPVFVWLHFAVLLALCFPIVVHGFSRAWWMSSVEIISLMTWVLAIVADVVAVQIQMALWPRRLARERALRGLPTETERAVDVMPRVSLELAR